MKVDQRTHAALHRVQRAMGHLKAAEDLFYGPDEAGDKSGPDNNQSAGIAYTDATAFDAEGARVGVVTCLVCGAAILLDPRDTGPDLLALHAEWHRRQAA